MVEETAEKEKVESPIRRIAEDLEEGETVECNFSSDDVEVSLKTEVLTIDTGNCDRVILAASDEYNNKIGLLTGYSQEEEEETREEPTEEEFDSDTTAAEEQDQEQENNNEAIIGVR